ncbi:MAG: aldose 1-epimerase family protein [Verrucomicrobiota bacterium JB022]|nr:aldose 1-epimerase family protein [Verrucomicrobiota bacterium JB022]
MGSLVTLQNQRFTAKISAQGAEICSLYDRQTQTEHIWQGDVEWWAKHAPILFPIVGSLKDNRYTYRGVSYEMPRHGLARTREWELIEELPVRARFRLNSDAETRFSYPFDWQLVATYQLEMDGLHIRYKVRNIGQSDMYFSLGSHPALNVPWIPDCEFEDHNIVFSEDEVWARYPLTEDGLLSTTPEPLPVEDRRLRLNHPMFERDALVLKGIHSRRVQICCEMATQYLEVDLGGAPDLGIWQPAGAPFVCIEPWFGHSDPEDHDQDLTRKPGILRLESGEAFRTAYSICVRDGLME